MWEKTIDLVLVVVWTIGGLYAMAFVCIFFGEIRRAFFKALENLPERLKRPDNYRNKE